MGQRTRQATYFFVMVLLLSACSPTFKTRVLTFFFDGVPGTEPVQTVEALNPDEVSSFPRPKVTPRPTPPPIVSVHEPVRERKCRECHVVAGQMQILSKDASMCDKCHYEQRVKEGWNHGPINLGTCIPCHVPHESIYPHLLEKPVPEVCLVCHEKVLSTKKEYHDTPNLNDCIACHDPHRMY